MNMYIFKFILSCRPFAVFAYGATSAGKTHTMLGSQNDPGVMYRTMKELFRLMDDAKEEKEFAVAFSYLEVNLLVLLVCVHFIFELIKVVALVLVPFLLNQLIYFYFYMLFPNYISGPVSLYMHFHSSPVLVLVYRFTMNRSEICWLMRVLLQYERMLLKEWLFRASRCIRLEACGLNTLTPIALD